MNGDPHQILSSFAGRIVDTVLGCLGDGEVQSIFVSGGFARNDIAAFRRAEFIEIYSDLDVYVILRHPRDLDRARRRVARQVAALPRETGTYRIFPEPDVGVYSEEDFRKQKTRPGTVEIIDGHVVLHGSKKTPEWARGFVASAIDSPEALYLLENRFAEIAELSGRVERGESDGFRRYFHYVILKSGVDAVTAVLIVLRLFHPSRAERMKTFRDVRSRGEARGFLPEDAVACVERCYEGVSNLQGTLEDERGRSAALRRDVESMLLAVWKTIAGRLSSVETGEWSDLLDWRCKAGRWAGNIRELSALAKRMSRSRIDVLRRSRRLAGLSPIDALRLSGTVDVLLRRAGEDPAGVALRRSAIEERYVCVLDELTHTFGYASGPIFERARRMFKETS